METKELLVLVLLRKGSADESVVVRIKTERCFGRLELNEFVLNCSDGAVYLLDGFYIISVSVLNR